MNHRQQDETVLVNWAGLTAENVSHGYDLVRRYLPLDFYRRSKKRKGKEVDRGEARRIVHDILRSRGTQTQISRNVINSWVELHKKTEQLQ